MKSVPPALIFESKPRPSTVSANVPWMSAQARTQREQTMHGGGVEGEVGVALVDRLRVGDLVARSGRP